MISSEDALLSSALVAADINNFYGDYGHECGEGLLPEYAVPGGKDMEEDEDELSSTPEKSTGRRKGPPKGVGVKRQEKPPFSYIALIAMAIHRRPDKKATLAEIYTFLQENYEFFRGDYVGWRNSIRHNLSLNDCFVKLPKEAGERGRKGHKWTISANCEYQFDEGSYRRRPRGYKARKARSGARADNADSALRSETADSHATLDHSTAAASSHYQQFTDASQSVASSHWLPYAGAPAPMEFALPSLDKTLSEGTTAFSLTPSVYGFLPCQQLTPSWPCPSAYDSTWYASPSAYTPPASASSSSLSVATAAASYDMSAYFYPSATVSGLCEPPPPPSSHSSSLLYSFGSDPLTGAVDWSYCYPQTHPPTIVLPPASDNEFVPAPVAADVVKMEAKELEPMEKNENIPEKKTLIA